MVNPFDRNFFKFFVGFVCILAVSFGVLYIVGTYTNGGDKRASVLQK
jgi:magnesium-transporting ATPase (P-type)